jgi:hypothetical protein
MRGLLPTERATSDPRIASGSERYGWPMIAMLKESATSQ